MAETVKKRFNIIPAITPGLRKFWDFLNARENGVEEVDEKKVAEVKDCVEAMQAGQYDKGDIVETSGNEYKNDIQHIKGRTGNSHRNRGSQENSRELER